MDWPEFIFPALVSTISIGATFFDGTIVQSKVMNELGSASQLTDQQKESVAEMCGGASTLMSFIAGIGLVLGNAILALRLYGGQNLIVDSAAVAVMIVFLHAVRVAAVSKLSDIDDANTSLGITQGTILRIELLILNLVILFGLVYGIENSRSLH